MVAGNDGALEIHDGFKALNRLSAVTDNVPEAYDLVDLLRTDRRENRAEGFGVTRGCRRAMRNAQ